MIGDYNNSEKHSAVVAQLAALRGMDIKQLRAKWLELYKRESPQSVNGVYLRRRLAYRIQELAYDGDSEETIARLEAEAKKLMKQTGKQATAGAGSVLTRVYNGVEHQVQVLGDGGFEYSGQRYRSLSAIAKLITGTSWNGLIFFGLKNKAGGKQCAA